jgi:hypothetical protein
MRCALLILILGCDSASAPETCPGAGGAYSTSYERLDGDCPMLDSQGIMGGPIGPPLFSECVGPGPGTACDASWSWMCMTRPGQRLTWEGSLRWDGNTATGEATLKIDGVCESRYAVTSHRR